MRHHALIMLVGMGILAHAAAAGDVVTVTCKGEGRSQKQAVATERATADALGNALRKGAKAWLAKHAASKDGQLIRAQVESEPARYVIKHELFKQSFTAGLAKVSVKADVSLAKLRTAWDGYAAALAKSGRPRLRLMVALTYDGGKESATQLTARLTKPFVDTGIEVLGPPGMGKRKRADLVVSIKVAARHGGVSRGYGATYHRHVYTFTAQAIRVTDNGVVAAESEDYYSEAETANPRIGMERGLRDLSPAFAAKLRLALMRAHAFGGTKK